MVVTILVKAHDKSYRLYNYYRDKGVYGYKSAPLQDKDYENAILLEEDEDDNEAFDYISSRLPNLLTDDDLIKMTKPDKHTEKREDKSHKYKDS